MNTANSDKEIAETPEDWDAQMKEAFLGISLHE